MSSRTIVVIGATGLQGSGAVRALLASTSFAVRAVTSNPAGEKARALLERFPEKAQNGRLELVQADLGDMASLENALESAYGVFAAWSSRGDELAEGENLVNAAKAAGIAHLVYSSFPDVARATKGRFHLEHLGAKAVIEEYAKQELQAVTTLMPGAFYSNLVSPMYTSRNAERTAIFHPPINPDVGVEWVDAAHDIGTFAAAVFARGPRSTANKSYPVASAPLSLPDLVAQYTARTGEAALHVPRSPEEAVETLPLPEEKKRAIGEMYRWVNTATDPARRFYGLRSKEEVEAAQEEIGVRASTFEEWMARSGWRV
ncbi:hypothetical protein JCM10207_007546 [Rhodosporidiobolus poonsookiae]